MRFDIITIFPEMFASFLEASLVGKAIAAGKVTVNLIDPREHTDDKHRSVDDTPYGGGDGMVLKPGPMVRAIESVTATPTTGDDDGDDNATASRGPHRVLLSPQGQRLDQATLEQLRDLEHLVLICGRYEGFDERVRDFVDREVSLGDFVLNGGEVAAMTLVDGISRLVPGVVGNAGSLVSESHATGLLEHPQYTRPRVFREREVPDVLLSGDHQRIARWRRQQMLLRTRERRPDLWERFSPSAEDLAALEAAGVDVGSEGASGTDGGPSVDGGTSVEGDNAERGELAARTYIALIHHPVYDRSGRIVTTAITNLDLHDIARSSRTFGLAGYYVVTPLSSQQELATRIMSHWKEGHGAAINDNRREALELIEVVPSLEQVVEQVAARHGEPPICVATSARARDGVLSRDALVAQIRQTSAPMVVMLGTGWGLAEAAMEAADLLLAPIDGPTEYNHLSVRSAAAIILDRLFGLREKS